MTEEPEERTRTDKRDRNLCDQAETYLHRFAGWNHCRVSIQRLRGDRNRTVYAFALADKRPGAFDEFWSHGALTVRIAMAGLLDKITTNQRVKA